MKRLLLLCFACAIACVASAQNIITYTNTKQVVNGVEHEGNYSQLQIVFDGNKLKLPQYSNLTYLYDHQENGWSIYYYAVWNNWGGQWQLFKNDWYAVSPDRQTLNKGGRAVNGGALIVNVYKEGVQHKSIGPMYE